LPERFILEKEGSPMTKRSVMICLTVVLLFGLIVPLRFNPASAAAPVKQLIVGVGQEPSSVDPSVAFGGVSYLVVENYSEYLICRDPNGDLKPGLATSWKISPDGKKIEFTLRKGVKFHNGDPFTAKDVQFSIDRGLKKNMTVKTKLALVERFEIVDDYHVTFHFKAPDVSFIPNRAAVIIVSKNYYDRVGEDKFAQEPVGTGPYKFVRYVPGEYVDIERFDGYWGDKPSVREARFLFIAEETTRLAKLKAGEVDIITQCPYTAVRDIEKSKGLKVVRLENNHPTPSILFSIQNPNVPWHDRRVRLAMAYAIDCDAIIKNVLFGLPNRYAFFAPYELGYDPGLKPFPYDPKKARELLVEAGYPKGFEVKLSWMVTGRIPMSRETAEAIAAYWEAVGIRTKLLGEEYGAWYSRFKTAKAPQAEYVAFYGAGRPGGVEPTYMLDSYFGSEGGYSIYSNPELDKTVAQARATVDDPKRGELIKKAARMAHDDVATIALYNIVAFYAMKENIDFKPTQKYLADLMYIKDVTVH
jgi:peptide/nickel transport system substrate-binding protein